MGPSNINILRERKRGTRTKKLTARRTDYDWQWLREGRDPAHPAPPSLPPSPSLLSYRYDDDGASRRKAGGRAGHSHGVQLWRRRREDVPTSILPLNSPYTQITDTTAAVLHLCTATATATASVHLMII